MILFRLRTGWDLKGFRATALADPVNGEWPHVSPGHFFSPEERAIGGRSKALQQTNGSLQCLAASCHVKAHPPPTQSI